MLDCSNHLLLLLQPLHKPVADVRDTTSMFTEGTQAEKIGHARHIMPNSKYAA